MANTVYDKYLETEILNADPVKLVNLLYRGALQSVATARKHLASGAIRERSKEINKSWEILHELIRSLDHSKGGELSTNLASLYAYMQTRLIEANSQQLDAPLKEVEKLLTTLNEGWQSVVPPAQPPAQPSAESHSYSY